MAVPQPSPCPRCGRPVWPILTRQDLAGLTTAELLELCQQLLRDEPAAPPRARTPAAGDGASLGTRLRRLERSVGTGPCPACGGGLDQVSRALAVQAEVKKLREVPTAELESQLRMWLGDVY